MMLRPLLTAAVLPLLTTTTAVQLAFAPAEGKELTKTFTTTSDLMLQDLSLTADGQDLTELFGAIEASLESENVVVVTDVYAAMDDGRPKRLERTFDSLSATTSISASAAGEGSDDTSEIDSPLEGETVVFTWNPELSEYDVRYADDSAGDEALLAGLSEDMDLRAFLPGREIEVGDSWEIELEQLGSTLMPGGNLGWGGDEVDSMDFDAFAEMFEDGFAGLADDLLHGTCTLTFASLSDVEGIKIANMDLTIEIDGTADMSQLLTESIEEIVEQQDVAPDITVQRADVFLEFSGEGKLAWNLTAGHAHSLYVTGDLVVGCEIAVDAEMDGQGGSIEALGEVVGTFTESVTVE
ncbi:MAG: hypothetical protein WD226_12515 [Planctomycetota bacterium]